MDISAVNTNKSLEFAHDNVKELKTKVQVLQKENETLKKQSEQYQRQTRDMGRRLDNIEHRLELNDHAQRRKKILIEGVNETEGENATDIAIDIISNIRRDITPNDIDWAQRITKPGGKRPILVIFRSIGIRDDVLRRKKELKQKPNLKAVWINEDANQMVKKQKSECRAVVREAQKQGLAATQRGTGIIVNDVYYPHNKLNDLPENIKLAHTRTRVSDVAVCFAGPLAVLSNMYEAPYIIDGKKHKTVEHGHFYTKAIIAKDQKAAQEIRDTDCPKVAKSIGKMIQAQGWSGIELPNLKEHMRQKYLQNEHCMKALLSTGTKKLLELTWDRKWATGYGPYSKLFLTGAQPGQNLTGYTLEELRTEFRDRFAIRNQDTTKNQDTAEQALTPVHVQVGAAPNTSGGQPHALPAGAHAARGETAGTTPPGIVERLIRSSPVTDV